MGKWVQAEYERVCTEKFKHLFYKASGGLDASVSYDADVERRFRQFVKNLDVDSPVINSHFRNIVKRQTRLDAEAEGKSVAGAQPLFPDSGRSTTLRVPAGLSSNRLRPGPQTIDPAREEMNARSEDEDDGWYIAGRDSVYDGYDIYPRQVGANMATNTNRARRSSALPPHPSGESSPPWSLSHERQRARTAQPPSSDNDAEQGHPLFLPVGDTPLPIVRYGDEIDFGDDEEDPIAHNHWDGIMRDPLPFPMDPVDDPRPDWMQLARDEIDGENETTGAARDTESVPVPSDSPAQNGSGSRRRRRADSAEAETTRAVRQRVSAGGAPGPGWTTRPLPGGMGAYVVPETALQPPRMQRTRRSMPPPLVNGRDTRRDGVVWDVDPDAQDLLDDIFDSGAA